MFQFLLMRHESQSSSAGDRLGSDAPAAPMHIYLAPHALVVAAQTICIGETRRPAAVLLWSASGRPFEVSLAGRQQTYRGRAMLLAPHIARSLRADDCGLLSINFEPGHPYYLALSELVGTRGLLPLESGWVKPFGVAIERLFDSGVSPTDVQDLLCPIAESLLGRVSRRKDDARILSIFESVEANLRNPLSMPELADSARLSVDRLSHLFVEQVGIPIRSYVVWRRYRRALQALHDRVNLADVAQEMGFSDQAHMSRTFAHFFAYQPSRLRSTEAVRIHS